MPEAEVRLSIITTCKGRLGHLQQTLPAMVRLPGVELVAVDYDCPDGAADWVRRHYPEVRTVTVGRRPLFNVSHARNVGAAEASGNWLCFMDADVRPDPAFSTHIAANIRTGRFHTVSPFVPELYGTCVVSREAYEAVGGYDEAMEPWSYEDKDFYVRLKETGNEEAHFPAGLLACIEHDDLARVRFIDTYDRRECMRRNAFYHHAKLLLTRALGAPPDLEWRRRLYSEIKRLAAGSPERSEITLRLPDIASRDVAPGRRIEATIVVALQRDDIRY